MKERLYILGDGGQARVCADCAKDKKIIFIKSLAQASSKAKLFVALGDNALRKKLFLQALKAGFEMINLIHETAIISPSAKIAEGGVVILARAIIQAKASIERGVIINTASVVEHDCVIEEFAHISVAAAMGGGVRVGKNSLVGVNATILPNLKLAKNSILGAGAVLTKDASGILVGNPATSIKKLSLGKII